MAAAGTRRGRASRPDLYERQSWPGELRFLLERYPREVWPGHANLGTVARSWLQRHAMFRELDGTLQDGMAAFRDGQAQPLEFRGWLTPRLRFFLGQLHEHHQVEDQRYFLRFAAAEPRLRQGFAPLEGDHDAIHGQLDQVALTANELLARPHGAADAQQSVADRYATAIEALLQQLGRHLDDEEDLIIPLILDRGEERLGLQP